MTKIKDINTEYFYKLIEGHSINSKLTGKYWVALAFLSLVTIVASNTVGTNVDFLFEIGGLRKEIFFPLALILISIFVIGFGSAHAQAVRIRKLIQTVIEDIDKDDRFIHNVHIQDFFDSAVTPTFNRVAPLSQILKGKHQFFSKDEDRETSYWIRIAGLISYSILKSVAIIIMYFIPYLALRLSYQKSLEYGRIFMKWEIPETLFYIIGIVGSLVLLQLLVIDLFFSFRVFCRIILEGKCGENVKLLWEYMAKPWDKNFTRIGASLFFIWGILYFAIGFGLFIISFENTIEIIFNVLMLREVYSSLLLGKQGFLSILLISTGIIAISVVIKSTLKNTTKKFWNYFTLVLIAIIATIIIFVFIPDVVRWEFGFLGTWIFLFALLFDFLGQKASANRRN